MSKLALLATTLLGAAMLAAAGCASHPVAKAIAAHDQPALNALLDAGVDLNAPVKSGLTPLSLAACKGNDAAIRELVKRGADVNYGTTPYNTPLFRSVLCDMPPKPRTVKLLLELGAKADDVALEMKAQGVDPVIHELLQNARKGSASVPETASPRPQPGNLDDAAIGRIRAAANKAPEARASSSDVDDPSYRGAARPEDFALVIGVEDYQSLPKADHGVRDARAVRKHLEALGFPARNIVSLEGSAATKSKLESYLKEWLPLNVRPESTLFVYYSGHGAPDPKSGDAYLVPWDGDPKFLKSSAYPLKSLYADLSKTKAKRVIVALDACFSGAGGRSVLAQGARPLVAKVDDGVPASARLTVLAAASGDEITGTLEEQGHGLFTYHLLKGLSADPKASARSLHAYLLPRVQDDARRQNREQTPTLAGASLDASLLP